MSFAARQGHAPQFAAKVVAQDRAFAQLHDGAIREHLSLGCAHDRLAPLNPLEALGQG